MRKNHRNEVVKLRVNKFALPSKRFRSNSFDDQVDDRIETFATPEGCTSEGAGSKFHLSSFDDQVDDRIGTFMTPEGCTQPGNTAGDLEVGECPSFI